MSNGPTRRELLSAFAKAGALTGAAGSAAAGYRLSTLPLDLRNLRMGTEVADRLSRSSVLDWRYSWVAVTSHVSSLPLLMQDAAAGLQDLSAEDGFVSTGRDGIAAGVTGSGRISTVLFPHTGATHQLPYYVHERGNSLLGAKPREGSFAGLSVEDHTTWLWADHVDSTIEYLGDTGVISLSYRLPPPGQTDGDRTVAIDEHLYVLPGTETIVRDYTICNEGNDSLEGEFVYHTQASVSEHQQNFAVWQSNPNRLVASDALRWTDLEGPYELQVYTDAPVARSGVSQSGPDAVETGPTHASVADIEGADTAVRHEPGTGFLPAVIASDLDSIEGRYLSGHLAVDLSLAPGEHRQFSVYLTGGESPERLTEPRQRDTGGRLADAQQYWTDRIADLDLSGIPSRFNGPVRRAVATLLMLTDPSTGSISASGNLQPTYYPSWPRDGAFAAVALARVGLDEPAKRFLRDFLPRVQESDGSFRQCYDSRGRDAGLLAVENDQQPIFAWAVREVFEATGDERFLRETWPAVESALSYTINAIGDNGLLAATPDIQEGPSAGRQSLWANAAAVEGLATGGTLATAVGVGPSPYRQAAAQLGSALHEEFFSEGTFVTENGFWGPTRDIKDYVAMAIWPSRWADEYGETERLAGVLQQNYEERGVEWIPGELLSAAALANAGETETADALLSDVLAETTPTGYLAEETTADGSHKLGSPLGWSSSALVCALTERYR